METAGEHSEVRRVVGLGSSAGGLTALKAFFDEVATDTDFAFVVVSHRSRGPSMLGQLLEPHTSMPVIELVDNTPTSIEPNHVYVAAGQTVITIKDGVLHTQDDPARLRYPIDHFFRSLADDQGQGAVAIVLSGSGSDGTRGIQAIKAADGLVFVQLEAEAGHAAMPHSVLTTNLEDFCLPVRELATKLSELARIPQIEVDEEEALFNDLFELVRARSGIDFEMYRRSTIGRRIARRMAINSIVKVEEYVAHLHVTPDEVARLGQDFLIGVTSFFRDAPAWEGLVETALIPLLEANPKLDVFRAWVPGCSTGEEAYTLAIVLRECMERLDRHFSVQIFATDVNVSAVSFARRGTYPLTAVDDVGVARFERFFEVADGMATLTSELRKWIVFAPHNILSSPPFTHLHLTCCRNLLIYFESEVQHDILTLLHHGLTDDGILFLGGSESLGKTASLFEPINPQHKLFRRSRSSVAQPGFVIRNPKMWGNRLRTPWFGEGGRKATATERILVDSFAPPCAIVDAAGVVAHVHGRTGRFLEPAPGAQTWVNVFDMARDGLRFDLADIHRMALEDPGLEVTRLRVPVRANGDWIAVTISAQVIQHSGPFEGHVLLSFRESETLPSLQEGDLSAEVSQLEDRLRSVQLSREAFVADLEAANAELKLTNEELQASNEELQSANEELETSGEEMQLLNEELRTVNDEVGSKIRDLQRAHDELSNLVNATGIAAIFIDTDLRIVSFTPGVTRLFKLIGSDVGRPFSDLSSSLVSSLVEPIREVLDSLVARETEVRHTDGSWFLIQIQPYRTAGNAIDGIIISFSDVSTDHELRERTGVLEQLLVEVEAGVVAVARDGAEAWSFGTPRILRKVDVTRDDPPRHELLRIPGIPQAHHIFHLPIADTDETGIVGAFLSIREPDATLEGM